MQKQEIPMEPDPFIAELFKSTARTGPTTVAPAVLRPARKTKRKKVTLSFGAYSSLLIYVWMLFNFTGNNMESASSNTIDRTYILFEEVRQMIETVYIFIISFPS